MVSVKVNFPQIFVPHLDRRDHSFLRYTRAPSAVDLLFVSVLSEFLSPNSSSKYGLVRPRQEAADQPDRVGDHARPVLEVIYICAAASESVENRKRAVLG